jgi:DNA-binding CsgD family transcriptional regulator
MAQVALATLALSMGRYQEAIDAVRPIVEADAPGFACQVLSIGVEAGLRAGDEGIAAECLRRLEERAPAAGTPWGLGQLAQARALSARSADNAERLYREAISLLGTTSIAPDLAHAHLLYGEWLRRENRRKDAGAELRTAHDQFLRMGAEGFARRARIELAATGEKVRGRLVKTPSRLTSQEAHVARLAATGATNAEIAARLFISASTVDYHLRKVFRKLEISSRRQLRDLELHGPWAAEDGSAPSASR